MNDSYQHVLIQDQAQWRAWLDANHRTSPGIWLVTWKKASGRPSLAYDAIVDEALAYGWVDSRPRRIDDQRSARLLYPAGPPATRPRATRPASSSSPRPGACMPRVWPPSPPPRSMAHGPPWTKPKRSPNPPTLSRP
jgi:hypothetical protein